MSGVFSLGQAAGRKPGHRDILKIVEQLLTDNPGATYCQDSPLPLLPRLASCVDPSGLDATAICRETTEVWDRTPDYVAIRAECAAVPLISSTAWPCPCSR